MDVLGTDRASLAMAMAFMPAKGRRKLCLEWTTEGVANLRCGSAREEHRAAQAEALTALALRCRVCGRCPQPPI